MEERKAILKVTEGKSEHYCDKASEVMANALLDNPHWRAWMPATDETRFQTYHNFIKPLLLAAPEGTVVAEAEDFAACTAWLPPAPIREYKAPDAADTSESAESDREAYALFEKHVGNQFGTHFYHLLILARDPRRSAVPGAVRAVLESVLEHASADKAPVWLLTTNPHARDIYLHFGFKQLGTHKAKADLAWSMVWFPKTIAHDED